MRRTVFATTAALLVSTTACDGKEPPKPPDEGQAVAPEPEPEEENLEPERKPITVEEAIASTVLVATPWGHGTGVFVHEDGWVLTNHHVIAAGANEDFGFEATVTMAKLKEDGSVEIGEKLDAVAHKVDDKRDLALLKIVDPKQKFPFVSVSETDPKPGAKVSAIGNAGVGFGWALKNCAVNAIGDAESFATAIFASGNEKLTDEEKERLKKEIDKAVEDRGKQVQTDCNILPGDSGGPLVDAETNELVGLNATIRPATSGFIALGSVAFHIHVAEVRKFMKKIPKEPRAFVPDPWDAAGAFGRFEDTDEDGEVDTLRFEGMCAGMLRCYSSLIDLDQSTFRGKKQLPKVEDVHRDRKFDAELAVVRIGRMPRDKKMRFPVSDLLVYANTDGKGKFDKLIVSDGETYKTRGYTLHKGKHATRDKELDDFKVAEFAKLFEGKKRLHKRAQIIAGAVGATSKPDISSPDKAKALEVTFKDHNEDGTIDTMVARTRLDTRVAIDLNQDTFEKQHKKALKQVEKALSKDETKDRDEVTERKLRKRVRAGKMHGEFLAVLAAPTRVYYDQDQDGKYDLLLEGDSLESGVALRARKLTEGGGTAPANEHLGRKLLRPALAGTTALAKTLDATLEKAFPGRDRADLKDGRSSFPAIETKGYFTVSEVPRSDKRAFAVMDRASMTVLADLDKNTFTGKRKKMSPRDAVGEDKFDAEFAMRYAPGLAWAYYDRNNDGRFDVIFVSQPGYRWAIAAAYTIDAKGKVKEMKDKAGKTMFDAELFKNKKLRKAFKTLETDVFRRMGY